MQRLLWTGLQHSLAAPLPRQRALGSVSLGVWLQRRWVQYEQTSQTMGALRNSKAKEAGVKWVSKSTKEYMQEGDETHSHAAPSLLAESRGEGSRSIDKRERYKEVRDAAEGRVEMELVRLRDEKGRRWKKGIGFFKRQGKAFIIFYSVAYVGTFILLYAGFATGFFNKEAAFEYMFFFLGQYIDKDAFYARVEAWDGKINLGFAFVINEMLELLRFPLVMFFFYQLRPLIGRTHRGMKKSIFRMNAAES